MDRQATTADPLTTKLPPDDTPPPPVPTSHPPAFYFIFWGEFAERSSYYGMRAILPLYLIDILHFPQNSPTYFSFKMMCYFLPLVGGYIADRFFGRYWTIVGFSVPYVLGHFILGIENVTALFIALVLLACGSGVTKPNISTLLGQTYDRFRPGQERLRSAAFQWFYLSINIGAVVSQIMVPIIQDKFSYATAFQFPAWVMLLALVAFASGKRHYAPDTFDRGDTTPEERRERWQTVGRLVGVFSLMIVFWVVYEHNDSIWVYFARDYVDRVVPLIGVEMLPNQIQFINAACVILFVPLFKFVFDRVDPERKVFRPIPKMLLGFGCTAASIGLLSAAGFLAQGGQPKVSVFWMFGAYIILTAGEVLLYGTGLELAYTGAPAKVKGFVTACFLATIGIANLVNMGVAKLYGGSLTDPVDQRGPLLPGQFFAVMTLAVLAATIAFYFVGRRFERAAGAAAS